MAAARRPVGLAVHDPPRFTRSVQSPLGRSLTLVLPDEAVEPALALLEREFARELASHSDRNYLIARAVKNCEARGRIESRHFRQVCPIVIAFDEQSCDPAAQHRGCFLSKRCERRNQNNLLDTMMRCKIERDRCA